SHSAAEAWLRLLGLSQSALSTGNERSIEGSFRSCGVNALPVHFTLISDAAPSPARPRLALTSASTTPPSGSCSSTSGGAPTARMRTLVLPAGSALADWACAWASRPSAARNPPIVGSTRRPIAYNRLIEMAALPCTCTAPFPRESRPYLWHCDDDGNRPEAERVRRADAPLLPLRPFPRKLAVSEETAGEVAGWTAWASR